VVASVVARGVVVTLGRAVVLGGVDLTVNPGQRIGLVGPNGVGKSTLLRVLAGQVVPERGTVDVRPPTASVGLLDQEPERRPGERVLDLLGRRTGVTAAAAALEASTAELAAGAEGSGERYDRALSRWVALGGADLDARAHEAWAGFGLAPGLLDEPVAGLSGGEAAKCSLVSLLLSRFDVVLLDDLTARAQREREWSAKGALKARRRPPDNDRALRSLRIEQSEQLAGRARRTERARSSVSRRWTSRASRGERVRQEHAAAGAGGVPGHRGAGVARPALPRSGAAPP
jgi:ABC-type transport system involved in cytochrome c biogenesis ATPase subunit